MLKFGAKQGRFGRESEEKNVFSQNPWNPFSNSASCSVDILKTKLRLSSYKYKKKN